MEREWAHEDESEGRAGLTHETTNSDASHIQLLEKGGLQHRTRGLPMVRIHHSGHLPCEPRLTLVREIVRQQVPKIVFHVFNWTFISFIQSILLFMISAPAYTILLASTIEPNVTTSDLAYLAIELGLVVTEYIADAQQWSMCTCTCSLNDKHQPKLTPSTHSLPVCKAAVQSLGQGPSRLQASRPGPRLHQLRPLGLQPTPQLRGRAVHLVCPLPVELLRLQDVVQLGRRGPRVPHHALPGLDLAD